MTKIMRLLPFLAVVLCACADGVTLSNGDQGSGLDDTDGAQDSTDSDSGGLPSDGGGTDPGSEEVGDEDLGQDATGQDVPITDGASDSDAGPHTGPHTGPDPGSDSGTHPGHHTGSNPGPHPRDQQPARCCDDYGYLRHVLPGDDNHV